MFGHRDRSVRSIDLARTLISDDQRDDRRFDDSASASASSAAAMDLDQQEQAQQVAAEDAIIDDGKTAHMLHLDAQWTVRTRRFAFRPLLHSPRLAAFTRYRHYNAAMLSVMIGWGLIVLQPWITGWAQVGLMIAYEVLLILPVFMIELTRFDRSLLWRLMTSFDWLWLIGNHILANVLRMLIEKHQPETTAHGLAYLACIYVVWLEASLYGFSLDALIGPSHRFRIVWMVVFILQVLQFYIEYQLNLKGMIDMQICVFYCSTAQSLLSASMLNVMIFSSKYCLSLIRNPQSLMIIGPRCKLTVEGGAQARAEEMQQRAEEALNESPLNELRAVSSNSAQL